MTFPGERFECLVYAGGSTPTLNVCDEAKVSGWGDNFVTDRSIAEAVSLDRVSARWAAPKTGRSHSFSTALRRTVVL